MSRYFCIIVLLARLAGCFLKRKHKLLVAFFFSFFFLFKFRLDLKYKMTVVARLDTFEIFENTSPRCNISFDDENEKERGGSTR